MANAYGDAQVIKDRSGVAYTDLGLADSAALTTLITALNERSSAEVERHCGRDFILHAGEVEKLDGTNRSRMMLRQYPVISIASVKDDGVTLATSEYRLVKVGGLGENAGVLERKNAVWARSWENWEVTYTWGYASVPPAVKEVVEDLVIRTLLEGVRNKKTKGASSIAMDGFSVTFGVGFTTENPTSLDRVAIRKLAPYKRVVIA